MNWKGAILKRLELFRLSLHVASTQPHPVTNGLPFPGFIVFPDHRRIKPRKGRRIQADVNGSYNIMRKKVPCAFHAAGIEGAVVRPVRLVLAK